MKREELANKRYVFIGPHNPKMPVYWPSHAPCNYCDPDEVRRYEKLKIPRPVMLNVCPRCGPEVWKVIE